MGEAIERLRRGLRRFLETVSLALMASLALLVVVAVVLRKLGGALTWYDEVASVLLAWLTWYGACLAALHRAHIGFPRLVAGMRGRARQAAVVVRTAVVVGFFAVAAWAGVRVLTVLGDTSLVSLPWVPARLTQSVVPVSAVLFIVAELLGLPGELAEPRGGGRHGTGATPASSIAGHPGGLTASGSIPGSTADNARPETPAEGKPAEAQDHGPSDSKESDP